MFLLVVILVFIGFFQSAFLSADLLLVVLIIRAFVVTDKINYYLGFGLGILVALLSSSPMAAVSLIYLVNIKLVYIFKSFSAASNWLLIFPITLILVVLSEASKSWFYNQTFEYAGVIVSAIFSIPAFFAIRAWEERFIPEKQIKLRLNR